MEDRELKDWVALVGRFLFSTIYGQEHVKTALALSLFGEAGPHFRVYSRPKRIVGILNDMSILLVGPQGNGKSTFLKALCNGALSSQYMLGGTCTIQTVASFLNQGMMVCLDDIHVLSKRDQRELNELLLQVRYLDTSQSARPNEFDVSCAPLPQHTDLLYCRGPLISAALISSSFNGPHRSLEKGTSLCSELLDSFGLVLVLDDVPTPHEELELFKHVVNRQANFSWSYTSPRSDNHSKVKVMSSRDDFLLTGIKDLLHDARALPRPDWTDEAKAELGIVYTRWRRLGGASQPKLNYKYITPATLATLFRSCSARARGCLRLQVTLEDVQEISNIFAKSLLEATKPVMNVGENTPILSNEDLRRFMYAAHARVKSDRCKSFSWQELVNVAARINLCGTSASNTVQAAFEMGFVLRKDFDRYVLRPSVYQLGY